MIEYLNFHTGAACLNALVLGALGFFGLVVLPRSLRLLQPATSAILLGDLMRRLHRAIAVLSGTAAMLVFYRFEMLLLAVNAGLGLFAWLVLLPSSEPRTVTPTARRGAIMLLHLTQFAIASAVFFRLAI